MAQSQNVLREWLHDSAARSTFQTYRHRHPLHSRKAKRSKENKQNMYGTWGVNKLTDADRKEIWLRRDEGVSMPDLAKRFNVSTTQIWRVCQERRIRTNVKTPNTTVISSEIAEMEQGGWGKPLNRHCPLEPLLTLEQKEEIWRRHKAGETQTAIAKRMGVGATTIHRITHGETSHSEQPNEQAEARGQSGQHQAVSVQAGEERKPRRPSKKDSAH